MKYIRVLLTIFISMFSLVISVAAPSFLQTQSVLYTGNYPNGLIVTENNAIVTDAQIQNPNGNGLTIRANNVLIDDVEVHNVKGHGVYIEDSYGITLQNSIIYDTAKGTCYPSCGSGWSSAVKIRSSNETIDLSQGILIQSNIIYENFGEGIGARGSQITIRNNTIYDNFSVNIYSNSDNVRIENNYVYCTGNTLFYRDGLPATGIAVSQESFSGWSGHAYKQTIVNNIIDNCKNGFAYNRSEVGVTPTGFRDSIIAFNTFVNTKRIPIRIDYESGQTGLIVHNNIGIMSGSSNFTGISYAGNVEQSSISFIISAGQESAFHLSEQKQAVGSYVIEYDFGWGERNAPFNVGAWE